MADIGRRDLLIGTAIAVLGPSARGDAVSGQIPWEPNAGSPPRPVQTGPWVYFTGSEAAAVEVMADRIIPPDAETPGGKDAGCAVFIDRQLAGPYGRDEGLYNRPPFIKGTKSQGPQSSTTPAELYRIGLAALDRHCRGMSSGNPWVSLPPERQDEILSSLETGRVQLPGVDGATFFKAVLKDVQEGFFADPLYGGNRDMCAWKMIGFPGAHYDYREWVGRHNERYPHPPVGIMGRQGWISHR